MDRVTVLKRKLRERRHELEGCVIEALETGAEDVYEVIAYCGIFMTQRFSSLEAANITHEVLGFEKLNQLPDINSVEVI